MLTRTLLILLCLGVSCGAQTSTKSSAARTTHTPPQKMSPAPGNPPTAIIHTTAGDMKCVLFPDKAPNAVSNFIGLATGTKDWTNPANGQHEHGKPLYDGVIFHRVIPGFMIQGGDPLGQGSGSPGYKFDDELHPDLLYDRPGRLAMANSGPNTNGSQFFITEKEQPGLNPCFDEAGCQKPYGRVPKGTGYTIFGQCDDATVALVKKIAQGPCQGQVCSGGNSRPDSPVKITHIEILDAPKAAARASGSKTGIKKPAATATTTPASQH